MSFLNKKEKKKTNRKARASGLKLKGYHLETTGLQGFVWLPDLSSQRESSPGQRAKRREHKALCKARPCPRHLKLATWRWPWAVALHNGMGIE